MDISIGDIVRRKSGGPEMTVEQIFDEKSEGSSSIAYAGVKVGNILCYWLTDYELCKAVFKPEDLEIVEKSGKPFL